MKVGSNVLITLTVIPNTFHIIAYDMGIMWLVKTSVLDLMKLLQFFTGRSFDFKEGYKATMIRDGLHKMAACM